MADIIDEANDRAQNFLDKALAKVPKPKVVKGIGVCLYRGCGAEVEGDRRWCGPECRDAWEQEQACRR